MAQASTEVKKDKVVQNTRYMRDKYREKVTGVFRYYEVPGGAIEFVYREFKEDPVERFTFKDGEIYTIPRGVARHLNKNCWYPEYEYYSSDQGGFAKGVDPYRPGAHMRVGKKIKRMAFESMEFMELEDMPAAKPILTVEHI